MDFVWLAGIGLFFAGACLAVRLFTALQQEG